MAKTVFTTTISLPKSMSRDMKKMTREEGRTVSELVREALRWYKETRYEKRARISWLKLRAKLQEISRAGQRASLASFVARDRRAHRV